MLIEVPIRCQRILTRRLPRVSETNTTAEIGAPLHGAFCHSVGWRYAQQPDMTAFSDASALPAEISATPAHRPSAVARARAIWHARAILRILVIRDLKVRYSDTVLGFAWTLLNPFKFESVDSTLESVDNFRILEN